MSARNEEGMTGGIVWVCEHGHVDMLHRRSSLDLCMTCGVGACEPRFTPGRRSKAQREQDKKLGEAFPSFEEERQRRRRRRKAPPVVSTEVKVTRGDGTGGGVVDATAFVPEAIKPPFDLTEVQRRQILSAEAKMPEIVFDRERPTDLADDALWPPAQPGDVVPVTANLFIVVLGFADRIDAHVLHYEVRDRRDEHDATPIKATKPIDSSVPATTLTEQWRPEREPAKVSAADLRKLAEGGTAAELERLLRKRGQQANLLKELDDQPRDVRWPIRKAIEAFDQRIREVEKQIREPERRRALKRRAVAEAEAEEAQERQRDRREEQQRRNAA